MRGEIVGPADSGRDVVELLWREGLPEGERPLDDPARVNWTGRPGPQPRRRVSRAHVYGAA